MNSIWILEIVYIKKDIPISISVLKKMFQSPLPAHNRYTLKAGCVLPSLFPLPQSVWMVNKMVLWLKTPEVDWG